MNDKIEIGRVALVLLVVLILVMVVGLWRIDSLLHEVVCRNKEQAQLTQVVNVYNQWLGVVKTTMASIVGYVFVREGSNVIFNYLNRGKRGEGKQ